MSEALDLKKVIEDIVSSYQSKVESISSILDTTPLMFSDFQESIFDTKEEREKINNQLRDTLAKNEHLRRKDFDNMMQGILATQNRREKEVRDLLRNYFNNQKAMAQMLKETLERIKDSLAKGEAGRIKEFQDLIKDILTEQDERKNEVTSKLKEFQEEQKVLTTKLKELSDKGRELRIRDFKSMLREFKAQREKRLELQKERKDEVTRMLDSFKKARQVTRSLPRAINIDAQNEQKEESANKPNIEIGRRG